MRRERRENPFSFLPSVVAGAHEMKRDIGFFAYHPAVVTRLDIEEISWFHLNDSAVVHRGRGSAGDY